MIAVFDNKSTTSQQVKDAAKATLREMLADQNTTIFITPLIRYEVLRGIDWQSERDFDQIKTILDGIPSLDITKNVSDLSANLFRYDSWLSSQSGALTRSLEKRKFDIFHYCSAKCYGLNFYSHDSDMSKINRLHDRYQTAKTTLHQ